MRIGHNSLSGPGMPMNAADRSRSRIRLCTHQLTRFDFISQRRDRSLDARFSDPTKIVGTGPPDSPDTASRKPGSTRSTCVTEFLDQRTLLGPSS